MWDARVYSASTRAWRSAYVYAYKIKDRLVSIFLTCEGREFNDSVPDSMKGYVDITKLIDKGKSNRIEFRVIDKVPRSVAIAIVR